MWSEIGKNVSCPMILIFKSGELLTVLLFLGFFQISTDEYNTKKYNTFLIIAFLVWISCHHK
jgi:hypothetical protein